MIQTFLQNFTDYLYENHKDNLDNVCVVFPSKRAGLYLKKYLSEKIDKSVWLPQIFAVEDFISELSSFELTDNITLIFELFEIHKEIENDESKSVEDFLNIADLMLHDFNDIDLYLVDPKSVFSYLSESKAISMWNLDGKELTAFQKKYLKFYNSLYEYYTKFKTRLINNRILYQGAQYRIVAENIKHISIEKKWEKIYFVGFNALTTAEESIIKSLQKLGIAEIFWDADTYYVDNDLQEAGKFMRFYQQKWNSKNINWKSDLFKNDVKSIDIIGISLKSGQAKYAGNIISEWLKTDKKLENSAIVLSDENLLFPLLNSLPSEIENFNLTMGLPFKNSLLYNLIDSILLLHENKFKLNVDSKKSNGFYFKDIINVVDNPFLKSFYNYDLFLKQIRHSNRIFYNYNEILKYKESDNDVLKYIFADWITEDDCLKNLTLLIRQLKQVAEEKENNKFENEIIYFFARLLHDLNSLLAIKTEKLSVSGFRKLFKRFISSRSIPFYGEPLEGLQIMGVLETRVLDFEKIVLLSVNEGVLPASKSYNSFIPVDIRKLFGMPDFSDKDAIFAYHFYRLIQRAKNISILYNTEPDEFSDGDKSRFIYQIISELPDYNKNIKINEYIVNVITEETENNLAITIKKDKNIFEKLDKIAITGFSASKIIDHINCPLQFYFKNIVGISELEETEEVIEANTLGKVIHEVLAELYKPYVDKIINVSDVEKMIPQIDELTDFYFNELYKDGEISYGINLLTVKMSKIYIRNLLNNDIIYLNQLLNENKYQTIKMLEKKMEMIIDLNSPEIPLIKLKGFVDRVDAENGEIRIVDYKTGKVEDRYLKINEFTQLKSDAKLSKCFQLAVYALLYARENPDYDKEIWTGILSLRNISQGFMNFKYNNSDYLTLHNLIDFEDVIKEILSEIFRKDIDFVQTEKEENCIYCLFKDICGR